MKPWKKLASRYVLEDRWLSVRADRCELPDGRAIEPYYVIEELDWVHVIALDAQGRVPLVRQYRHGSATVTLEFPGGVVDRGESPLVAAARELREETGCEADNLRPIGALYPNPARLNNRVHLFLAENVRIVGAQQPDDTEDLAVQFLPLDALIAQAGDPAGGFMHAMHIGYLLLALRELGRL